MGIPRFYNGWVRRIPRGAGVVLSSGLDNFRLMDILARHRARGVGWIYLDMNGIFHAAAQYVYAYGSWTDPREARAAEARARQNERLTAEELQRRLLTEITDRIEAILERTRPSEGFVMCVDGVAPPAKMMQQRTRRFRGEISEDFRFDSGDEGAHRAAASRPPPPQWDPNAITPGTPFMFALDAHLRAWIASPKNPALFPPVVYYSGHMMPGEGEHKIANLTREVRHRDSGDELVSSSIVASLDRGETAHIFYGLDADLFMITMINLVGGGRARRVYLMREETGDLVSLDALCEYIEGIFHHNAVPSTERFYRDPERRRVNAVSSFVVSMFLMGNDFLPHFGFLHHAVDEEIAWILRTCARHPPLALPGPDPLAPPGGPGSKAPREFLYRLNARALEGVLTDLAKQEPARLSSAMNADLVGGPRASRYPDPVLLLSFGDTRRDTPDLKYQAYRQLQRQRATHLALPESDVSNVVELAAADLAEAYVYTLRWVLAYYTLGHSRVDPRWFYPSEYTLSISDVRDEVSRQLSEGRAGSCGALAEEGQRGPWDDSKLRQLLAVLPASSRSLLPAELVPLTRPTSAIADMYPLQLAVDRSGTHADHHGIVLVPMADLERIEAELDGMRRRGELPVSVVQHYDAPENPVVKIASKAGGAPSRSPRPASRSSGTRSPRVPPPGASGQRPPREGPQAELRGKAPAYTAPYPSAFQEPAQVRGYRPAPSGPYAPSGFQSAYRPPPPSARREVSHLPPRETGGTPSRRGGRGGRGGRPAAPARPPPPSWRDMTFF